MWINYCVLVLIQLVVSVWSEQQSFRIAPSNTSANEGGLVTLKCQVDNKRGNVQWTKDGFALGFDREIPGYPRYRMSGSESLGEHHLVIESVRLEDDAEYQCQVGRAAGQPSLKGIAFLSVNVMPKLPMIEGYTNGSIVKVSHNQLRLNLTCVAKDGKPAATFRWFRNGVELKENVVIIIDSVEKLANKLENGRSTMTMVPRNEDNDALFKCQATNPAMPRPTSVAVQLSVLHPPGIPEITGYNANQVVKTGDTMKLTCISRGGNPLAQVYWYRNGDELDFSYTSGNGRAENELIFTVQPVDNNATYRCQASNQMTTEPFATEIRLTVQFAPEKVTITGHQNAKSGDLIVLKCESAISNPASVLSWFSRGRPVAEPVSATLPSTKGGFVTSSEIRVNLTNNENDVIYQCHGTNEALGQTVVDTITLKVMYPPGQPTIEGYTEGRSVYAGSVQSMTCTAVGGNPLATLKWKKGDRELEAVRRVMGTIVSSMVSFLLRPEDNNADYRCTATNPATVVPLEAVARLKVSFPPKSLNITISPKVVQVGQQLVISCRSSSSNPVSELSWWSNGDEIPGIDGGVVDAEFGGKSSVSRLEITPRVADHGAIYECRATNVLLKQAVSDAVTLNVLYPPYFPPGSISQLNSTEGNWTLLNLTAVGNPSNITYTWFFSGRRLLLGRFRRNLPPPAPSLPMNMFKFKQNGSVLNLTDVKREDHGTYVCQAINDEGNTTHYITLNVHYPVEIVSTSPDLTVDQGEVAVLNCTIRGNPIETAKTVVWSRAGFDMSRVIVEYDNGLSQLRISSAVKEDSGEFQCIANNGVGLPVMAVARLFVKSAPLINKSPFYIKAAADSGKDAILICQAKGVPVVEFTWFRGATLLVSNRSRHTIEETTKIGLIDYESRLVIHNSSAADYDSYKCIARNDLGDDFNLISLDGISAPDVPYDVQFVNATHNSITLAWKPGFDGGAPQSFQVAYNPVDVERKKYEDVPPGSTIYTIKDLKLGTEYEMTVKAFNRLGPSPFQDASLRARTSAVAPVTEDGPGEDIPLIIILAICIVGLIILALNIVLILFFIRRRRKKLEKDGSDSASQANTLEMFNAPVMVDDSNKSFTTFDHRSLEDFQDDMKAPFDVTDDAGRFYGQPGGDPYYPSFHGPHPAASPGNQPSYRPEYDRGSHPVGSNSQEGLYPNGVNNPMWDGSFRGPYTSGSMPREGDNYTEQLRKMQQNHLSQGSRNSTHLPATFPPHIPTPPVRSSSRGAVDSLAGQEMPFRYYNPPADDLRYGSQSESLHPQSRGQGLTAKHQGHTPLELRGHLV